MKGTCRIFPFPRRVKFRPEYCFHLPVLFRPDPTGSTREPAGKRRKKRRFLRDPSGSGDRNHRPGDAFDAFDSDAHWVVAESSESNPFYDAFYAFVFNADLVVAEHYELKKFSDAFHVFHCNSH